MSTLTRAQVPATGPRHRPTAGRGATAARFLLGGFFVAMATVNLLWTLPDAERLYGDIAESLAWPGVDRFLTELVVPHAGPLVVALAVFEVAVGLLLMGHDRSARWGLAIAVAFMLGLFGVVSAYALANLPLVALAGWLWGREHDRSLVDVLRRRTDPG